MEKTIKYIIFVLFIIFLASALISTLIQFGVQHSISVLLLSAVIIVMILPFFLILKAFRKLIRSKILILISERKFLLITLSGSFILSLISILLIDSKLYSDFLQYHLNAIKICNTDLSFSYLFSLFGKLYWQRPLVNLVPVYLIFGPNLMALQLYNAILNLSTGLMLYYFVKDSLKNLMIARVSLIIFFCLPVTYLSLNIPSHDIPGLFYMMLGFLLFGKINKKIDSGNNLLWPAFLSLLMGLVIFILQLSRSTGVFYFYSLLILFVFFLSKSFLLFFQRKRLRILIVKSLLLFIIPMTAYYLFNSFFLSGGINQGRYHMMFISTDTSENCRGGYTDIVDYKRYYYLVDKEDKNDMALGKIASELYYNYPDYLKLLIRKNDRLFSLGDDNVWAQSDNKGFLLNGLVGVMWIFNKLVRIFLYFFAISGMIYLLKKYKLSNPFSVVLLCCLTCSALLILIGEVSPRYAYLFLICITVPAAIGFLTFPLLLKNAGALFKNQPRSFFTRLTWIIVFTGLVIVFLTGLNLVIKQNLKDSDLVYRDLRAVDNATSDEALQEEIDQQWALSPQEQPLKYMVRIPAGSNLAEATWIFTTYPGATYEIRGFLRERNDREEEVKHHVFINDLSILPANDKPVQKKMLKTRKDYSVSYFSYSPITTEKDSLTVRFLLESGINQIANEESSDMTTTFLEFLQIVRLDPEQKP